MEVLNVLFGVLQMLVAEFIFLSSFKKRKFFALRASLVVLFQLLIVTFVPEMSFGLYLQSLYYLFLFFVVVLCMWFCFCADFQAIFFGCIAGRCMQNFARNFYGLCVLCGVWKNTFINLAIYVIIYVLFYFLFARNMKNEECINIKNWKVLLLSFFILVITIFLTILAQESSVDKKGETVICLLLIICCFLPLIIQFDLFRQNKIQRDLDTIQYLRIKEQEHYKINQEIIELVNIKYHDLKKQLDFYKNGIPEGAIEKMEEGLETYSSFFQTENEALDAVLMEASLLCSKNNIRLECIADGKQLKKIDSLDVYSLFRNALDNAVEGALRVGDIDKRFIGVKVYARQKLLFICIYNYYEDELKLDKRGFPLSSKQDTQYHGFGVRSMELVAKKYNGTLSIKTDNHLFCLNFLIPL